MKTRYIFLLFFTSLFFNNCVKNKKPLILHTSYKELEQKLKDKKAQDLFNKAFDNYEIGELSLSKRQLEKALKIEKHTLLYNQLGIIEVTTKNYEEAINLFKKGQKLDPKFWGNYINESRCYLEIKEYNKAEKVLNNLIVLTNSKYWKSYANFYLAIRYINDGNQCEKSLHYLNLSKEIQKDEQLKDVFKKIKNKLKKNCG